MGGNSVAKPQSGLNLRMAEAGRLIIENPALPIGKALVKAGYSATTARNPTENGLCEERCLAAAAAVDPDSNPAKIISAARQTFLTKLRTVDLGQEKLAAVAKAVDVAERYYGGHDQDPIHEARSVVDRVRFVAELMREMKVLNVTDSTLPDPEKR